MAQMRREMARMEVCPPTARSRQVNLAEMVGGSEGQQEIRMPENKKTTLLRRAASQDKTTSLKLCTYINILR